MEYRPVSSMLKAATAAPAPRTALNLSYLMRSSQPIRRRTATPIPLQMMVVTPERSGIAVETKCFGV